jgi:lipase ATG15
MCGQSEAPRGCHKKAVTAFHGRTSSMLLPIPLANLALSFLSSLFPEHVDQHPHVRPGPPSPNNVLNFHLRHFHVETPSAHVYFANAPHDLSRANSLASVPLSIVTSPVRTTRPASLHDFQAARQMSKRGQSALLDWQEDEVSGPDVTRRGALLLLAKMTSNTYYEPYKGGWYNLTDDWNVVRHSSFSVLRGCLLCFS